MVVDANRVVLELEYRSVVPLTHALGTRISCLTGRIWITQHGNRDDIVLEAGEAGQISHAGLALVQALRPARVALHAPPTPRPAAVGLAARLAPRWTRWAIAQSGVD
jgi:hypothetical protein